MELVGNKTETEIDLDGGHAVSRVADIAASVRKASDRLYAACQAQIPLLDAECRPLLSQNPSTRAVKEVTALIQKLNRESEIGTTFRGNLNGMAFHDLVSVQYIPRLENKMIQSFWESTYADMPGTAEEDKAYAKRESDSRKKQADLLNQAKLQVLREERETRERQKNDRIREQEERLARIAENAEQTQARIAYLQRAREMLAGSRRAYAYVRADGTVKAVHNWSYPNAGNVADFRGIRTVVCTGDGIVGLRHSGSCIATTTPSDCQSQLWEVGNWKGIVALAAGEYHVVGLRANGTCVATSFQKGSLRDYGQSRVENWRDVKAIACGNDFTVGLKHDGTLLFAGNAIVNENGCISSLTDIAMIAACESNFMAVTKSGELKPVRVRGWGGIAKAESIVQLVIADGYPYALQADGTLLGGREDPFQAEKPMIIDRDVLAMGSSCGFSDHLRYVRQDGSLRLQDTYQSSSESLTQEKPFENYDTYKQQIDEADRKVQDLIKQVLANRAAGLCQHCGGAFKKTLFGTKCGSCGKKKDY